MHQNGSEYYKGGWTVAFRVLWNSFRSSTTWAQVLSSEDSMTWAVNTISRRSATACPHLAHSERFWHSSEFFTPCNTKISMLNAASSISEGRQRNSSQVGTEHGPLGRCDPCKVKPQSPRGISATISIASSKLDSCRTDALPISCSSDVGPDNFSCGLTHRKMIGHLAKGSTPHSSPYPLPRTTHRASIHSLSHQSQHFEIAALSRLSMVASDAAASSLARQPKQTVRAHPRSFLSYLHLSRGSN